MLFIVLNKCSTNNLLVCRVLWAGHAVTTATLKRMVVELGGYAMQWDVGVRGYHRNPETHMVMLPTLFFWRRTNDQGRNEPGCSVLDDESMSGKSHTESSSRRPGFQKNHLPHSTLHDIPQSTHWRSHVTSPVFLFQ